VVWVLGGCLGLVVIAGLVLAVGGFFVARKVEQAGRNPGFAAAKLIAQMNPEVEIVSSDEDTGAITLREKKTGKVITFDFRDIEKGRLVFTGEGGEKVEIAGEGESGSMEVKTGEGTVRLGAGAGAKIPGWLPDYPGSQPEGTFSAQGKDGDSGAYHFKTGNPVEDVARFYEEAFQSAGFEAHKNIIKLDGNTSASVTAQDSSGKREAHVGISEDDGETQVAVNYKAQ
jgi:hypothetical protein